MLYPTPRRALHDPPAKGGGHSGVVMFGHTLPLSLRRSTINVENVGVRLWQSSAICLRAFARSAFQWGVSVFSWALWPPPVAQSATPPAKGGGHSSMSLLEHTLPL